MFNLNLIKEFKSAGMVSKRLVERVVLASEIGSMVAPAAINPALPQSDKNISGHSTAENPIADKIPEAEANPAAAPEATPSKSQKDYLMNSAKAALGVAEACMESVCEGKCFEDMNGMDQARMTEMAEMYGKLKEFKNKMEDWSKEAPAAPAVNAPAVPAAAPIATAPAAPAEAVAAAPAPAAPIMSQAPAA